MSSYHSGFHPPAQTRFVQPIRRTGLMVLAICSAIAAGDSNCLYSQTGLAASTKVSDLSAQLPHEPGQRISFAHSELTFEPNLGQDPSNARFISYGRGYELRLDPDKASVVLSRQARGHSPATPGDAAISLQLLAANPLAAMLPQEKVQGEHSYFPNSDPKSWITHVPQFGRVTYQGVYPGVDLSFYGNSGRLEYDFILQPNSEATTVQLATRDTVDCRLDTNGDLHLRSGAATITLLRPVAYQLSPGGSEREPVSVQYRIRRSRISGTDVKLIGFSIGRYDHRRQLIIDPVMLYGLDIPGTPGYSYPPYYFADTNISAMTADAAGNTYVAAAVGNTYASTNILKFDPTGNLVFNASLGTPSTSIEPTAIAVNGAGDVYLAGEAGAGLPTTTGAFEASGGGAFLAVINATGSALTYSTYLGGGSSYSYTEATGLTVDSAGQAYVTGYTGSSDFPTTAGAYQTDYPAQSGEYSGFVAKFNPTLSGNASLVYSTFLSGYGQSQGNGIAVDTAGDAYVIATSAPGFPVTQGAYNFDGPADTGAYVTKLNPSGSALVYSAYLGPANPNGIAVDGTGEAYVAGNVAGTNFPVTTGAYQTSYPGGFAAKLNSAGSALLYSTYLSGPSGYEMNNVTPSGVAILPGCASSCEAYISGNTTTTDFPLIDPIQSFPGGYGSAPAEQQSGFTTGFLVELGPIGGASQFSTYLGGASSSTNGPSSLPAVAVDSAGNVYFASNIEGSDAPVTLPAVQYPGYGFLAKVGPTNAAAAVAVPAQVTFAGSLPVNATTSTGGTVELRNLGSAALTLTRPFVFSSPEFAETDNCPASIPAGGICTVTVSFTPDASGQRSATLSIPSTARNSPTVVALGGSAIDAPDLQVSPTSLTFADQVVTTSSAAQVVTLTNSGDQPQPITAILNGTSDYQITSHCPAQIAAGTSCQVSVVFAPTQIGMRDDYLTVELPGPAYFNVALEGTGVVAAAGNGTLQLSPTALSFGSVVLSQMSQEQIVALMNTGNSPVTINALGVSTIAGQGNPGDFSLAVTSIYGSPGTCGYLYVGSSYQPYSVPFVLEPQTSCAIYVAFQPSIAGQEAGTLTVTDSAVGSPQSIGLSGVGLSSQQPLTITPSTMTFPTQPLGDPSAGQTFTITNPGNDFVKIDRTFTTGDFAVIGGNGNAGTCGGSLLGPQATCTVSVLFDPTKTGSRAGTLTLTDSISGTPSLFNLAGTGIAATGTLALGQPSLTFASQDVGTTSESQEVLVRNPGNSPVTINSIETTPEFAVTSQYNYYDTPSNCGGVLSPGAVCAIDVAFSPAAPAGTVSGSLTIHSTAGTLTVSLLGTGVETAQAIHITPTTINFGGALIGATTNNNDNTNAVTVYIDNTGGAPVTFSSAPSITGTAPAPGADFVFADVNCSQYLPIYANSSPIPMSPGGSCSFKLTFVPSLSATEQATFALADSAGTQTIALSGVGMTTSPPVSPEPPVLAFDHLAVGASSPDSYDFEIALYNNGTQSVTISSVVVSAGSADFALATDFGSCAGVTVTPGSSCNSVFYFHPSAMGYRTGTVTFTNSLGNQYTAALAGYGDTPIYAADLSPQALVMASAPIQPAVGANTGGIITLNNMGNTPLTVGTVSGTNVASGDDFPTIVAGGSTGCTGVTVQPGTNCSVSVGFTPLAAGQHTGNLTFPVTYANKTTATLTATLSGTGQTPAGSSTLLPQSAVFSSAVAGTGQLNYQNSATFVLTNTGNVQLTMGTITGTDLTTTAGIGGDFVAPSSCSFSLSPGTTCNLQVYFAPLTTGLKSGSFTVPITYSGGATATLKATFTGQGVAAAPVLQVSPSGLAFNPEVVGTIDSTNTQTVTLSGAGNTSVTIKSVTASPNFTITSNNCGTTLTSPFVCTVTVGFTPLAATAPGTVTGTLTFVDNTPGSPQVVKLSGQAISAAQELSLSQTTVSFANQKVGTASTAQVVYLTDLDSASESSNSYSGSPSLIQINSIVLGGVNASDFTETQTCGGSLGFTIYGRTYCMIAVAFAPGSSSFGPRTATVTINLAQGSPLVITLKGNGIGSPASLTAPVPGTVLPGPDVTFSWAAATGATGYALRLGTTPGANNLYGSGEITATSAAPTNLPTNGETVYATLITYYYSVQVSNSYAFAAAAQAALTSPAPGSTLSSPVQTFTWSAGAGATSYKLWAGSTGKGSNNLFTSGVKTTTSATASGLPANGETVYVRLFTDFNGETVYTDYTYDAAAPPAVETPIIRVRPTGSPD
jgi:hypothetical protein